MSDPLRAQALYRRWRPQTFEEVIGQDHITRTLRNAVTVHRLAHAYLFTGPRGTGKTSVARILAKAINCTGTGDKPCNACSICVGMTEGRSLDLIEIDAASNTGVDDVRDLREKIGFAPNEARYKVYVVDEVHMLSTAAFNALLKTLEEPPPHAVFVLATTDPHRIPDTIVSRCQRHDFRRTPLEALMGKLERICAAEGIAAQRPALELVARAATGSVRDAESLLDQLAAAGTEITVEYVRELLGTPEGGTVAGLADALADADAAAGLRLLGQAFDQGAEARHLQGALLDHLRQVLLVQTGLDAQALPLTEEQRAALVRQAERIPPERLTRAIHLFNDARPGTDLATPSLPLELAMVEAVAQSAPDSSPGLGRHEPQVEPTPATDASAGRQERAVPPPRTTTAGRPAGRGGTAVRPRAARAGQPEPGSSPAGANAPRSGGSSGGRRPAGRPLVPLPAGAGPAQALDWMRGSWPAICDAVAERDRNTAALLKDCLPVSVDDGAVTLGFFYEFHCRRVSEPQRAATVAEVFERLLGARRALRCVVTAPEEGEDAAARPRTVADQARQDPVVRHAVDELGGRISGITPDQDAP